MEAELNRENINTSYPSASLMLEVLAEGEAIVPDSKPDILDVLCVEGHCDIEKTELQKGRIIFTGIANFTVLYRPEHEDSVKSVCANFPFNHIHESEGITSDDKFCSTCTMVHTECSLINSRKISLKGVIALCFKSYNTIALSPVTEMKIPDIQLKSIKTIFSSIAASAQDVFTVSDILEVPVAQNQIDELLLCRATIVDKSVKIVTGKAVIKGSVSVFQLYNSDDGTVQYMEHELPFTEITDVPNLTDDMLCDVYLSVANISSHDDINTEKERRITSFACDIKVCILAFKSEELDTIADAYLPGNIVDVSYLQANKTEITERLRNSLTLKESAELPEDMPAMEQICPVYAYVSSKDVKAENGRVFTEGTVNAVITYITQPGIGPVESFTKEIHFSNVSDCPDGNFSADFDAEVTHCDYNFVNQSKLDIRCIVDTSVTLRKNSNDFPVIESVTVGEQEISNRPSIVIYFVKSGDSLWNIAKRYNTTIERILLANNINADDILNIGMRLLIPA